VSEIADRTLVLAVGLEQYDYGDGMALPGAATGAVRFATWALSCGVPAGRVMLACSWLNGPPPLPAGVCLVGTTRDELDKALQDAVAAGGDLLLLYWCGHGVLSEERKRVLFTSNATAANKLNISVDEMLMLLSSTQGVGFDRQILLVDACANFVEDMRFDAALPLGSLARGRPRQVQQFVLYAAEQGRIAAYDRIERRAAFSTAVLAWLEKHAGRTLPPDMQVLRDHIKAAFQHDNESGEYQQTPVSLVVTYPETEDRVGYGGGLPVSGRLQAQAASGGLAVSQVQRLAETVLACETLFNSDAVRSRLVSAIGGSRGAQPMDGPHLLALISEEFAAHGAEALLRGLRELATTETHRLEIIKVEQCWNRQRRIAEAMRYFGRVTAQQVRKAYYLAVPPDDRNVVRDLEEAMEHAALYIANPDGITPLTRFVVMLEHLTGVQVPDEWFQLGLDRLHGLRALAPRWLAVSDARLVVDLHVGGPPSPRLRWPTQVRGYLHRGKRGWRQLEPVTCSPTLQGMQDAVHKLIDRVDQMGLGNFTVGFILNRAAFETAPEWWIHTRDHLTGPVPIGQLHPVVLHIGERFTAQQPRTLWKDRVSAIRARLIHETPDVCWIEPEHRDRAAIHRTVADSPAACIGLAFAPGEVRGELSADPIVAAVAMGAPYVVWVDQEPDDWRATRRNVAYLVEHGTFDELAKRIHRSREEEPGGLRLLWDEPEALPRMEIPGVSSKGRQG
jgi:vWA-MoxR associated protein C-terminal domain/Caspase domain